MKFEVEIDDDLLGDANSNLENYDLGSTNSADVLKTMLLLWFEGEFDGDQAYWEYVSNHIKVTEL